MATPTTTFVNQSGTISATGEDAGLLGTLNPTVNPNRVTVGVSGTFTGSLSVRARLKGLTQFYPVPGVNDTTGLNLTASTGIALTANTNAAFTFDVSGCDAFEVWQASGTGSILVEYNAFAAGPDELPLIVSQTAGQSSFTATTVTSASANALAVGPNGTTNPTFNVDASTASAATGIQVKSAAAGAGVAVSVVSSGTNENLTLDAKGSGTVTINGTATGNIVLGRAATGVSLAVTGALTSSGTAGIGYATGAGGTVTQITSRTTGVTINKTTGAITLVSAAGSATPASFTVTNSTVAANDTVVVSQQSGTDLYVTEVTAVGAGSFRITFYTTGGTTTEQPVFNFAVIKGVAA